MVMLVNKEEKEARNICWFINGNREYCNEPVCPCDIHTDNNCNRWRFFLDNPTPKLLDKLRMLCCKVHDVLWGD